MDEMELVYWDHSYNKVLLVNLAIAVGLFTSLRLFSGVISHINPSDELTKKDNPAFGISLAGAVFAITIVLAGAIYGDPVYTLKESVISVGLYGGLGIILMALTRVIFDRIALPDISIRDEIVKGNVAAGIIDAGNVVATAIIIYAAMVWVATNTLDGIVAVLTAYVISQVLLTASMYMRVKLFFIQSGKSLQDEFKNGNTALALRFAGRRIGLAFAITAASHIMVYEMYDTQLLLAIWAGVSVVIMALLSLLSFIANKIILAGVDVDDEVINQQNTALGIVQCVIYISLGLLLAELMA